MRSKISSVISIFNWKLGLWSSVAQWLPAFFAVYPAGVLPAVKYATLHGLFRILWAGFFGGWTEKLSLEEKTRWKGYLKGVLYPSITSNLIAYGYHHVITNPEALRTALVAFCVSAFVYAPSTIFLVSHPATKRYFAKNTTKTEDVD